MKTRRYGSAVVAVLFILGVIFASCAPRMDDQRKVEAIFIKHLNKTAAKLELNPEQKTEFERLKAQIRQNFDDGRAKRQETLEAIKREGAQQQPDVTRMTRLFQGVLSDQAQRINNTFDLMLEFNNKLTGPQKEELGRMISAWVARWD
jgi:hypothetical protein